MNKQITIITLLALIVSGPYVLANTSTHGAHGASASSIDHYSPDGTFNHQAVTDGVRAEFQIMSLASRNIEDPNGATHHIMVKLFHDAMNHQIKNGIGKIKVIGPDTTEQTTLLKDYGGIFAANFSFSKAGKYGVICLLKVNDKKHLYKFWYTHR